MDPVISGPLAIGAGTALGTMASQLLQDDKGRMMSVPRPSKTQATLPRGGSLTTSQPRLSRSDMAKILLRR